LTSIPEEAIVDLDISGMSAPARPGWDIGAAPARFLLPARSWRRNWFLRKIWRAWSAMDRDRFLRST